MPPVPSVITGEVGRFLRALVQRLNSESFVSQTLTTNSVVQPDPGGTAELSGATALVSGTSRSWVSAPTVSISGTSHVRLTANAVLLGNGSVASTATLGFCHIPTQGSGVTLVPTGSPLEVGGYVPMMYDRQNSRLRIYDTFANSWKSVTLT